MTRIDLQTIFILPFSSPLADLASVGGKGANLARMAQAGLQVPEGFVLTTRAYRLFVEENGLEQTVVAALEGVREEDPAALEAASARIRSAFASGTMPKSIVEETIIHWDALSGGAVAVRSSATAEDLPEMSFAGQQDTYLNVLGEDALLEAVIDCWSSLWTARAIGYRQRNGVPHAGAALAVIVQKMVQSEASGVLFTANPLNGVRSETVIDATLGLGEALVSGQVEPDHYVVNAGRGIVLEKKLGEKKVSIRGRAGGGIERIQETAMHVQALADPQILEIAQLGDRVAELYHGEPQDIEWAYAEGRFSLLQTRPITSLYPTPAGMPAEPLQVMFSFGAVQGMLDPITPVGRDVLALLMAAVATMMFRRPVTIETQHVLYTAGERLWANITPVFRSTVGRKVVLGAARYIEPTVGQALNQLWDDPRLKPERAGLRPRTVFLLAQFVGPIAGNILLNLLRPAARRESIQSNAEQTLQAIQRKAAAIQGSPMEKLRQRVDLLPMLAMRELPGRLRQFLSAVATGMMSLNLLNRLTDRFVEGGRAELGWHQRTLEITRGLPHNPTTEMDLALWQMARAIRSDPRSAAVFAGSESRTLAQEYFQGKLPATAQNALKAFLDRYGGRGLAEIDTGRERWSEDPTHVLESLIGYLQIEDETRAPDVVFGRSAKEAQAALRELVHAVRRSRGGLIRARMVRFFARRVRELMGLREAPKFFAVRMMAIFRNSLLESGQDLAAMGTLERANDVFFLSLAELRALAEGERRDWQKIVNNRRDHYNRELLRRQIPRLLLSDGRAFYEGVAVPVGAEGQIAGSPVSPGTAEGLVRIVLDPRQAGLLPGEILVCPGTDPSWTPLFLTARGLVMEVGGMMTHGAVVAREYGIPAIVGVDKATQRLQTGQRIRMDGSTGTIQILVED